MPRKDRSFTGADLARLYCRNLPRDQRAVATLLFDECVPGTPSDKQFIVAVLGLLADAVELSPLPAAGVLSQALGFLRDAADQDFTAEEVREYLGSEFLVGI